MGLPYIEKGLESTPKMKKIASKQRLADSNPVVTDDLGIEHQSSGEDHDNDPHPRHEPSQRRRSHMRVIDKPRNTPIIQHEIERAE